jgi:hypothetical protein
MGKAALMYGRVERIDSNALTGRSGPNRAS